MIWAKPCKEVLKMENFINNKSELLSIAKFFYQDYEKRIRAIRNTQNYKLSALKDLKFRLVEHKKYFKKLQSHEIFYNPQMSKKGFVFHTSLKLDMTDLNLSEKLAEQIYFYESDLYHYYQRIINNANGDIKTINESLKQMKQLFRYYEKEINLQHSNKAKITLYDIAELEKGNSLNKKYLYSLIKESYLIKSFCGIRTEKINRYNLLFKIHLTDNMKKLYTSYCFQSKRRNLRKRIITNPERHFYIFKTRSEFLINDIMNKWF